MEGKQIVKQMGIDAQTIYRKMAEVKVGNILTYDTMKGLIKRDVQNDARGAMETARRKALREDRMVFEAVSNVGLKRLDDLGIISVGADYINKIRRYSRKGAQKITCVTDFDALPNEEKIKHNAALSILAVMSHITKNKSLKAVEQRVIDSSEKLPIMKTLEAFKNGDKD